MRRPVCLLAATALTAAVGALGACSSGSTPLAQLSNSPAGGGTTSATGTATGSSSAGSTATASPTTTATGGATSAAAPTKLEIVKAALPAGLTTEAQAVANAWYAYWDFAGVALSEPASPTAVAGVGKVATGQAAADLIAQIQEQQKAGQHIVGTTRVDVRRVTASGSSGSLCSQATDVSFSVDSDGRQVNPAVPRSPVFNAVLQLDGPLWRVVTIERVQSC